FGRVPTDGAGRWTLRTLPPAAVPGQAPYLSVAVFARGLLHHLFTRIYLPGNAAANAVDPLLASLDETARATLVAHHERPGVLRFDVHLQGAKETVFLAYR
nr:protocatechuate 3,4-dioxygenase subunit alpha [Micromonospora sp. DSM 115978]